MLSLDRPITSSSPLRRSKFTNILKQSKILKSSKTPDYQYYQNISHDKVPIVKLI